jgi:hypothetical protein
MTAVTESGTTFSDDLQRRQATIRRRQLLLALEQWAPAYQQVAGGWLLYVVDLTDATAEESAWLEKQVAENGMPDEPAHSADEWHAVRRTLGRQANAAASAAFLAGDYDRAQDLIDEARAYGAVLETEWRRLHEFIAARGAESAENTPAG